MIVLVPPALEGVAIIMLGKEAHKVPAAATATATKSVNDEIGCSYAPTWTI